MSATVNPKGATVNESFEFGTTTAYGQSTASQRSAPSQRGDPVQRATDGAAGRHDDPLPRGGSSDFGTFAGADRTFTTAAAPAPTPTGPGPMSGRGAGPGTIAIGRVTASPRGTAGTVAKVKVTCAGAAGTMCSLTLRLTVVETLRGHRLVAASAVGHKGGSHRSVLVGTARVSLLAGQTRTVRVVLNAPGRRLVNRLHGLRARLQVTQGNVAGGAATVFSKAVAFKAPAGHHSTR